MQTFIKFGLSSIFIAALVACGGGGSSDPSAPPTVPSNANGTGSPSVFLPTGQASASYNLSNCEFNAGGLPPITATGGTAVLTINASGIVTFIAPVFGASVAVNETWDSGNIQTTVIEITRSMAGNLNYYFTVDDNGPVVDVQYEPSSYVTNTKNSNNQVRFTYANGNTMDCGFVADPAFTPNFTDYNARIAQQVNAATLISGNNITNTITSGVAQWQNGTNNHWARLNLSTGQLSSSTTQSGTYSNFNIATALSSSTNEAAYQERRIDGAPEFRFYESNTTNGYRFGVLGSGASIQLDPRGFFD